MEESKPVMGRPTKYDPKYCQMLIDHMATGLSFETFGATIDVARATIFNWADEHAEFLDAKKRAFDKCQVFWEKIGVDHILNVTEKRGFDSTTQSLNTGVWVFNMKNRFKWTDRIEHSASEVKPILFAYDPDKEIPEK